MHRFHFSSVLKRMSTIVEAEGDAGTRYTLAHFRQGGGAARRSVPAPHSYALQEPGQSRLPSAGCEARVPMVYITSLPHAPKPCLPLH